MKKTIKLQYARLADEAAIQLADTKIPPEGWLASVRKAMGMSGPQLAKRLKLTKAAIYQAERNELEGAISIKQLQKLARSMNSQLVYAIIPDKPVNEIVFDQAKMKAETLVQQASIHMGLEKQSLTEEQIQKEIIRIAKELANEMPSDLWEQE